MQRARFIALCAADMLLSPLRFPHNKRNNAAAAATAFVCLRGTLSNCDRLWGDVCHCECVVCDEFNSVFVKKTIETVYICWFCSYMRYHYNLSYTT